MEYILCFILGVAAGTVCMYIVRNVKSAGTLIVADNDEGDPYLFLDMDMHPNEIKHEQHVMMRISHK